MKKLACIALLLTLLGALSACQLSPTATPAPAPTAVPPATNTPLPPTETPIPTATPTPALNSPNGPPLRAMKMFTAKDGWGVISNALLVTHDGGKNWFSVPIPDGEINENSDPSFVDMNTVYVILPVGNGRSGMLHRTFNGGGTWESFAVPFSRGLLVVKYNVDYFLEIIGDDPATATFAIYVSGDRGDTWNKIYPLGASTIPETGVKTGLSFITIDRGWVSMAGQDQKIEIYRTDDTGNNWKAQTLPAPQNISSMIVNVQPPSFFPQNEMDGILPVDFIARDGGQQNRVFYSSTDGGQTWLPGDPVADGGAYTFLDPKSGWVWGKGGVYYTDNGGQTWQVRPVAFGRSEHATCLSFVDVATGWMLTTDSKNRVRIYNTGDGGSTWMAVNP